MNKRLVKTPSIVKIRSAYVNHYGANFKIANQKRGGEPASPAGEYDVLCRQVCIDKTTYTFVPLTTSELLLRKV